MKFFERRYRSNQEQNDSVRSRRGIVTQIAKSALHEHMVVVFVQYGDDEVVKTLELKKKVERHGIEPGKVVRQNFFGLVFPVASESEEAKD